MDKDITSKCNFGLPDDEYLPLTQCACGKSYNYWDFVLSVYPNDPEEVLRNFMLSGKSVMNVAFKVKGKVVIVANISPEHAERLLEEFRIMREEDEQTKV